LTLTERDDAALRLLLEAVYERCGYDFREYSRPLIHRRVHRRMAEEQLPTIASLHERVLHDEECMQRLVAGMSISVTAMFRDPTFYVALRDVVVPLLRTHPFVRVWDAGCSTGEETYSLAILLREEALETRTRLYATDIDSAALRRAKDGCFPLERMREYTCNYIRSHPRACLSEYYRVRGGTAQFDPSLVAHTLFAQHNLVSDGVFNEFNLVVCCNVMIYFSPRLQQRVHDLLYRSLARFGVLALGDGESIRFTPHAAAYSELGGSLYRRIA
jgi:chemotaxis protein methyltransferase CheR